MSAKMKYTNEKSNSYQLFGSNSCSFSLCANSKHISPKNGVWNPELEKNREIDNDNLVLYSISIIYSQNKLTGPYFGQEPPGLTPKIFAPDESFLIFCSATA